MITTVIFDLDGTLTDPIVSFRNNLGYALSQLNIPMVSDVELKKWIGPPLGESLKNFLGLSQRESDIALGFYRKHYIDNGVKGNEIYCGVKEMLISLKQMGVKIGLATAKLERFAVDILKMHGIFDLFDVVSGATENGVRIFKGQILAHAISLLHESSKDKILMVGDRYYDILGARENNLKCIGVLWGYGEKDELENYKADFIAENPKKVVRIIENENQIK